MILYDKTGHWVTAPYDAALLAVVIDDVTIYNPMRTPDDSGPCSPEGYGWTIYHTGGGCMAYRYDFEDGSYMHLTDDSGCDMPTPADFADNAVLLGRYDADGEGVALVDDIRELPKNGGVY